MGRFERGQRKKAQAAKEQPAPSGVLEGHAGKLVLAAKVEYPATGDGVPTIHTQMDCNGQELVMAVAVIIADFGKKMVQEGHGTDLDVMGMVAQVQMGVIHHMQETGGE